MQVVEWEADGDLAWVERAGRRERVNMLLLGPQPVGTWVLVSLGFAKEVVEPEQLALIEDALTALAAALDGDYDPAAHFKDIGEARDERAGAEDHPAPSPSASAAIFPERELGNPSLLAGPLSHPGGERDREKGAVPSESTAPQ
jgi:hydrogenase expression/formation protein HypC